MHKERIGWGWFWYANEDGDEVEIWSHRRWYRRIYDKLFHLWADVMWCEAAEVCADDGEPLAYCTRHPAHHRGEHRMKEYADAG